jgi:hypothetical protein
MDADFLYSFIPLIVVGLLGLLVGGFIGILIANAGRASPQRDKNPKDLSQLVRLWRDRRNNKMVIEVEGRYFTSNEKLTARQQTVLQQIGSELLVWLNPQDNDNRVSSIVSPSVSTGSGVSPVPPVPTKQLKSNSMRIPEPITVKPPSLQVGDILANAISPEPKTKEEESPKSIAAQIDEILQETLPKTPLSDRAIRLVELPERGLVVLVDGQVYDGVADVPDLQVRQLIQYCVTEWEKTI